MQTLFLDIETTGLHHSLHSITSMVWFCRGAWHKWVNGKDDPNLFLRHWHESHELCTYNGKCFDEHFICRQFGIPRHPCHTDLRYVLARRGLRGGLKRISAHQGLVRPDQIHDVDGWMAVRFWESYRRGIPEALDALIFYNAWDVLLLIQLYDRHVAPMPAVDPIPWSADMDWIRMFVDRQHGGGFPVREGGLRPPR
jgi:uncharacterized protein YprB with RNaseH-like and TPR domain